MAPRRAPPLALLPLQLQLSLLLLGAGRCGAQQSFSHSISVGRIAAGSAQTLFSRGGAGCLTYFWYTAGTGEEPPSYPAEGSTRLRYYVDGEPSPSVDMALDMGHGVGFDDRRAPWSAGEFFGKSGTTLAFWNTLRVPFGAGVRVELFVPPTVNVSGQEMFYVILRGTDYTAGGGFRGAGPWPSLGGWTLPPSARLRLLRADNVTLAPLETLPLVLLEPGASAGALYLTVLQVLSGNSNFLEGCVRARLGGGADGEMLMSSGTEDYFGSSFYFSGVPDGFTSANAGLTHLDYNASEGGLAFSAYKVHDRDAFMWPAQTAVNITWRNGDVYDAAPGGSGLKCTANGTKLWDPQVSQVTAYAFVYSW